MKANFFSWFTQTIVPCLMSDAGPFVTKGTALDRRFWRALRRVATPTENDGTAQHAGGTASTPLVTPGVPDW